MNSNRISYHTELKCLARENLLSTEVLARIPRSNIWRWKHEPADKYKSFDLNLRASNDYELIKSFSRSKKAKLIFWAYVRLSKFFVEMVHRLPKFHKHIHDQKIQVVRIIERVRSSLGLRSILHVFGISVNTFHQWKLDTFTSCFDSIINRCNRIYPTQLSKSELKVMKDKLLDPNYQYWPISSIAFESIRNGSVAISLNTWYKYAKRLGVVRPRPDDRSKKRVEGIRAMRPNQIWHADITRYITVDNVIHYIYFVVDNFSRKILSWRVADRVSALIRRETIGEAMRNLNNQGEQEPILLITDGGPENSLEEYLQNLGLPIVHQKAMIDVQCSNSLIEAHNKVIKYNYLYRKSIRDGNQLIKELEFSCTNFNDRPHISLNGLTPNESHTGMILDHEVLRKVKIEAAEKRKIENLTNRCETCAG